ncbi:MAG: transcription elongation factor GreA [Candidatus Magasanikbacteria bacterium CG10_big_fil_rev_8_21_14_0_10_43_6]|uniref:Transcription elongation factor GreA n=1 Tax=Candidatus Magasanikbacteria bacterium CG10_big_fil_rev_8_21_14_0_10_43_6 TaxID=1974650 RepID=A0A2M6VZV7_9BACT|nr:MAG: transcription elongation factor GreA [Candidatus Magasanikbacteria bacterium CG10_big_fil_rev_8_21_14_0_10_43_6]
MRTTNRISKQIPQAKDPSMTKEKYASLEKKLARLEASRPAAAAEVSRLAELGDFSENVEYQLAKRKLRGINNTILFVENELRQAQIISPKKNATIVALGHTVSVETQGTQKTYTILGSSETNPTKGIISQHSPIGSALLGKKIGEHITITIAGRDVTYTVLSIS